LPQQVFGRHSGPFYRRSGRDALPVHRLHPRRQVLLQVTDSSGTLLLSTDPVTERTVTVKGGVIGSYNGTTHATDGKTACGSLAVSLMPFADAGSRKAAYVVWLTAAANFDGNPTAVDSVCGAGCFHGFHSDVSRAYGFRVEDKASCEPTFCVSGVKFNDVNGNGIPDAGELGLPGVEIRVTSEKGSVLSTLTGADGSYRICGLTDDVAFRVTETLPFGYLQTGPLNRDFSRFVHARGSAFIIDVCDADIAGLISQPAHPQRHRRNQVRGLERQRRSRSRRAASGRRDRSGPGRRRDADDRHRRLGQLPLHRRRGRFYVLTEVVPAGFGETVPATTAFR
jgi:hypothetical protein